MTEYIGYLDEDHAPVVDMAQEIVRCRDCEHYNVWDLSAIWGNHEHDVTFCLRFIDGMRMEVEPDGFCAWGKRRNNENV